MIRTWPTLLLLSLFIAAFPSYVSSFNAFTITIAAHDKQCFVEKLKHGDPVDMSYQVNEGGDLDVDFWIISDDNRLLYSSHKQSTDTYGFIADRDGQIEYCFSNQMTSVADKVLTFIFEGPEERVKLMEQLDQTEGIAEPLQREIEHLANGLRAIRDEQSYMVARERAHRNTAESTNSRVMWWALIESILLIGVCLWQVYYLRRFFEVKRVV
ncbi:hypothetical protein SeMB42_g03029 [Synchytrium endobioticum]|uniref:GOLD domain-containing protein n=1 Tax=Synchytrium endobioticum TaxID=286115 RepID=A0A507D9S2_9FUNG|nr:hypothetical protein SeLEV6574_g02343 [Synchytrium endobioticum]TPX48372.1 hypothetical protein SeMB42_g03029 [Synchytrium endobioticum]